jgi:filamentous hemagglutinin
LTAAKINDPSQVYYSLKSNIDAAAGYDTAYTVAERTVVPAAISARELQVAIPPGTTSAQWDQISKAIQYGQSHGVTIKITVVKQP